jgi:hypothetical protein
MNEELSSSSPFTRLEQARPLLEERVRLYQDELCNQMLEVFDRLEALEQALQSQAEIQENYDARLNAMAYRKAAGALVEADPALALAAREMCFRH